MFQKTPNYIKYIYKNTIYLFLFILLFRVVFFYFSIDLSEANTPEIRKAILLGIRFDLKLAIIATFPLHLLILIVNYHFFKKKVYKIINSVYLTLTYIIITLFYLTDFGYYEYLAMRLDASSLRFLSNLKISTQVLVESYPVYKGFIGMVILGIIIFKLSNLSYKLQKETFVIHSKKRKAVYFIATFLLLSFGIYNSITHYPLRWSEAFFSKDNKVNQFGLNPVLYFFDSFAFRSEGVNKKAFENLALAGGFDSSRNTHRAISNIVFIKHRRVTQAKASITRS